VKELLEVSFLVSDFSVFMHVYTSSKAVGCADLFFTWSRLGVVYVCVSGVTNGLNNCSLLLISNMTILSFNHFNHVGANVSWSSSYTATVLYSSVS